MTVPVLLPIHSRKTLEQSPHKGMLVKYLVLNRVNPDIVLDQETSKCRISLSQLTVDEKHLWSVTAYKTSIHIETTSFSFPHMEYFVHVFVLNFNLCKCGSKFLWSNGDSAFHGTHTFFAMSLAVCKNENPQILKRMKYSRHRGNERSLFPALSSWVLRW